MTIYGTTGRLGKGKTLAGVIQAYQMYCEGVEVYSNMWLDFPHIPVRNPMDMTELQDGFFLGDELWAICDSRKSYDLLTNAVVIIALRSRKKKFSVFYTQQFVLQVDRRLRFYTDYWIKPEVFPDTETGLPPELLRQHIVDGDGFKRPDCDIDVREYLTLYDTDKDPYTVSTLFKDEAIRRAIIRSFDKHPEEKEEYEKAQHVKDKPIPKGID